MNYYSEWDPYTAQWIRNLIDAGLIPPGHVDTRSITDVQPSDLAGYRQCHFFAGIAGWSLAARLAGWPDDRELWTGSAPCQPFSVAGKGKAQDDDRHLWPHFLRLIRARRPAVVMGEQVAAAVGKNWLDGVSADLEGIDYACRATVVPACAVDAPHRRDRLWFVAHSGSQGLAQREGDGRVLPGVGGESEGEDAAYDDRARYVGNADVAGACEERQQRSGQLCGAGSDPSACNGGNVADCNRDGCKPRHVATQAAGHRRSIESGSSVGHWSECGWLIGHDGKARRFEPSIRLLAHGVPGRVGRLRAYGNAIVPQVAAEVIGAYMDCYPDPDEQLRAALATN
ncbi:DNA cytosine methyltransferase [Stenotrophomonas maltophilia]|uniref:DNA cytosine methyltransferase n=1 Tax=Stenotrophomonas maltophilia TaxID=40324 RepID=UPI0009ABF278|nr:DNA cytosine methyltransferase [Stenotrophomonas maltophilia]MBA0459196.1 DNA cytosine methyltransferase [Stenotrophomonas maltophilia]MBC8772326.1 DNA cytosine methyltransferase [Stenotrophomonas maltophilia]